MSKMCIKCLHYYDDNLQVCPFCNNEDKYNIEKSTTEVKDSSNSYLNKQNIKDIEEVKKINITEDNVKKENNIFFIDNDKKDNTNKKTVDTKVKNRIKKNSLNIYSLIVLIISFILLFIVVLSTTMSFDIVLFLHYSITSIILIFAYRLSLDKKTGYYLGIVASLSMILMIIEKDYVNFIVGIYLFFSSFSYLIRK